MDHVDDNENQTTLPTTMRDDVVNPHAMFMSILGFIEECRYLAAYEVFKQLQQHFHYPPHSSKGQDSIQHDQAFLSEFDVSRLIEEKGYDVVKLKQLPERVKDIHDSVRYQDDKSEWTLGADMFGVKTFYKLDEEDNSIIVKLEGKMDDLPMFELCAVMKEVDLFTEWVPFCRESVMLDRIGRAEIASYVYISTPVISRDCAFQAFAADCMFEHGIVIIAGKSIDEYPKNPIPFKPVSWGQNKATIIELKVIIDVIHPTSAKITMIFHVDPHTSIPKIVLNFVMRNLAGVFLYLFSKQAIKVHQDLNSSHARRIREDTEFYRDWLLPKVRAYCEYKGWEQPVIESLGMLGIPEVKSGKYP